MKLRKIFMPVFALAILFSVTMSYGNTQDHVKAKSEYVAESATQIKLETKEAYKLDDAEYKGAVLTKTSLAGMSGYFVAAAVLIGLMSMVVNFWRTIVSYIKQYVPSTKFQIQFRLMALVFAIATANIALAAMALFAPILKQGSINLGVVEKEELEKLLTGVAEKHKAAVKTEIQEATSGLMKTEELAAKLEAIGISKKTLDTITEAVEKQGTELRKLFEGATNSKKGFEELLEEKSKEITGLATGESRTVKLFIPKEAVMKTLVQRSALSDSTLGTRLPEIGQLDYNRITISNLFRRVKVGPNSNGVVRYIDQQAVTRNAASRAEGAAAPESVITWIEKTMSLQKIMDSIPVTKESFNDLEFVKGELDTLLRVNMALKEDEMLYSGDGIAPNGKGINIYATSAQATLEAAPWADSVDYANVYDLIAVLKQVISAGKSMFVPDFVTMNGSDIIKYKLVKGTDGHYVLPPFISANGQIIDNVRVVESNQVTAGTLTIGDAKFAVIHEAEGLEVEMGYINDQFTKDQWTIKATKRQNLLVRDVYAGAFKKLASIDDALAAIEKP
jgi:HK97 family phage major capsid protein